MTELKYGSEIGTDGNDESMDGNTRVTTPGNLPQAVDRLTRPSDVGVVMGDNQADRATAEIGVEVLSKLKGIARPTMVGDAPSEDDLMQGRVPVEFHVSAITPQQPVVHQEPAVTHRTAIEVSAPAPLSTQVNYSGKAVSSPAVVRSSQKASIYAALGFVVVVGSVSTFVALSKSGSPSTEKNLIGEVENGLPDAGADGGSPVKK